MNDEITEPTVRLCWNDFAIRGAVQVLRAAHLDAMADDMEAQLKPAEPIEFASVVREKTGMLFVRTGALIRQPWESGNDSREWTELKDPEVLRVGIGEPPQSPAQQNAQVWQSLTGRVIRFCMRSQNCRMADGHDGGCQS